jgi:hypothetical protein
MQSAQQRQFDDVALVWRFDGSRVWSILIECPMRPILVIEVRCTIPQKTKHTKSSISGIRFTESKFLSERDADVGARKCITATWRGADGTNALRSRPGCWIARTARG